MNYNQLVEEIKIKKSLLCVGLDSDLNKIPSFLLNSEDPIFEFNKAIIDSTHQYTVAYKPNLAFYESLGIAGWQSLEKTMDYLNTKYPNIFTIADAKRGDIGNTSKMYAKAFFEHFNFDAVTVAPYMGEDSVMPFLEYENKWVILLALTSNKGAFDFQMHSDKENRKLFEKVLEKSQEWADKTRMMYVVGATKAEMLKDVRAIVPEHFLLVPGVGAQGGSLEEVLANGANSNGGLLINSSRGIIYASNDNQYQSRAAEEAFALQKLMKTVL
ncbi:MAG: orotidine-5'-phosphate decarboxylase [Bacteroidales bacterium]|nr:orotidine-5'-phosphate decarboxylase [Bacteroidales bacterium]